jgi:hypothetical protein
MGEEQVGRGPLLSVLRRCDVAGGGAGRAPATSGRGYRRRGPHHLCNCGGTVLLDASVMGLAPEEGVT